MLLNNDFLNLYEELNELNESRADIQRLIDFAGEDLANRFLNVKSRLKVPENDLYYWIKNKTQDELEQAVVDVENSKSVSQTKKDIADAGAELIQETAHWKVYHITSYEASQKYGRDTKWCITGINDYGDKYWKEYTDKGIIFYFLITKENYDARGTDSKFAIAKIPENPNYEIYNQQDDRVDGVDIPYYEELNIPEVDLEHSYFGHYCNECGMKLEDDRYDDGYYTGPDNEMYCENCFDELFFVCRECGEMFSKEDEANEVAYREIYCNRCYDEFFAPKRKPSYLKLR